MPKSIEQQFLKKVHQLDSNDQQTIADVLRLQNHDSVQVALCTDGGSPVTPSSFSPGSDCTLFDHWRKVLTCVFRSKMSLRRLHDELSRTT
jgi:hypothetical protein